jgi:hypothetical protein
MKKSFLLVFSLFFASFGQDITLSKDSMQVYNNGFSSYADNVMFTSHSSARIRLDSAFVFISQLDTVGYGRTGLELAWTPLLQASQQFVWTMADMGQDSFRLVKKVFYPLSSAEPLFFSGVGTACPLYFLQIGSCFQCDVFPKYPRYLRGTLRLFFSNGQALDLRLWSQDLRTAVKPRVSRAHYSSFILHPSSFSYRYLANGRRVPAGNKAVVQENRISGVKEFEKK